VDEVVLGLRKRLLFWYLGARPSSESWILAMFKPSIFW
jgi:hypothetical protein